MMNLKKFRKDFNLYPEIFEGMWHRRGQKKVVDYYRVRKEINGDWEDFLVRRIVVEMQFSERISYSKKRLVIAEEISVSIYDNLDEKYFRKALEKLEVI